MRNARPTTATGFTLIELMVTLVVLGIVISVAVPSFQNLVRENRAAARTNEFISALNLARSEAVEHNRTAIICQSSDPEVSSPNCDSNAGSWHEGWIVFVDGFRGGDVDGKVVSKEIIKISEGFDGQTTLDGNGTAGLSFESSGIRDATATAEFDLAPNDCDGQNLRRHIRVPPGGRPAVDSHLSC